jgi:hypothetical protein
MSYSIFFAHLASRVSMQHMLQYTYQVLLPTFLIQHNSMTNIHTVVCNM